MACIGFKMMTDANYGIVLVTAASQKEAETIASHLLEAKLAACVALTPVESFYVWQGKMNCDREWQLTIKTNLSLFEAIFAKIKAIHSYEVPEIIALPIVAGTRSYLNWIGENTQTH